MRYSHSSKISLLSLTLLIFSAGITEIVNPYSAKAVKTKDNSASTFLNAQVTPQVTPQATPQTTPSPVNSELGNREGGDVTLWWLLFLCLGLPFLLAWLGSKRGVTTAKPSTLILTPETGHTARIYWELSPEKIQGLRRRGGENLVIRLTDVTNINPQITTPEMVQQVDCSLGNPLISLQVPEIDREYQAELGCVTNDGGWVSLAKSAPAYFPVPHLFLGGLGSGMVTAIGSTAINSFGPQSATQPEVTQPQVEEKVEVIENTPNPIPAEDLEVDLWQNDPSPNDPSPQIIADSGIEEAEVLPADAEINIPFPAVVPTVDDGSNSLNWGVVGGGAAVGVSQLQKDEIPIETPLPRINLIPSDEATIKVSWVLPESIKTIYQSRGGGNLVLRIYNVTGIDPEMPLTGIFCQFAVEETGLVRPLTLEDLPNNQQNQIDDLPSTETDRELFYGDYQGELGYLSATDEWLGIAKSNRVRLPLVGETQIHLDIHTPEQGYIYWEIAPRDHQSLNSQGCRDLILRIHDSTNIDIDGQPPHTTQEYICKIDQGDRYVPIIIGDRPYADYIAELGYITNRGEWLRIIRSLHTRFFSL